MNHKSDENNDASGEDMPGDRGLEHEATEPAAGTFERRDEPAGEGFAAGPATSEAETPPPVTPVRRGVGTPLAVLALLLSLAALAASGFLAWQNRTSDADAAGNEAAIAELERGLGESRRSLQAAQEEAFDDLNRQARRNGEQLAALERELQEASRQNQAMAARIGNLEGALSSLQGVSAGVRDTWLLAEAEYYMQIANAQLQLAGNPEIAAMALNFADERIRQMANPALSEVRSALTGELQTLQSMETVDLEGLTLELASLADRVNALPLATSIDAPADDAERVDPELTGFARAADSMKRAFSDIVSVRRTDEPMKPLLAPDAAYFLRANLTLALQSARLALMKGEDAAYRQALDDAASWLEEYYDSGSRAVANALETIGRLRESGASVTPPDISGSLRLLRQYRTLREAQGDPAGGQGEEQGAGESAQ